MSAITAAGWFEALNEKAMIAHFTREKFGALRIPLPPLSEQTAVVRFLDHADRGIGADVPFPSIGQQRRIAQTPNETTTAIERARRQIELLHEYRTRLIADIATGKLDVREGATALPEVDPLADEYTLSDTLDTDAV